MTDREILELLLEEVRTIKTDVGTLKTDMTNVKSDVARLKRQLMESTAKLSGMDSLILEEVERVHDILDSHKADKTAHTA